MTCHASCHSWLYRFLVRHRHRYQQLDQLRISTIDFDCSLSRDFRRKPGIYRHSSAHAPGRGCRYRFRASIRDRPLQNTRRIPCTGCLRLRSAWSFPRRHRCSVPARSLRRSDGRRGFRPGWLGSHRKARCISLDEACLWRSVGLHITVMMFGQTICVLMGRQRTHFTCSALSKFSGESEDVPSSQELSKISYLNVCA